MFKRVEKKLAKKKKEKELGITEEIREAIGLNDVDSDSSSSHDSEDSSSTASPRIQSQRKRLLDDDEPDATSDVSSEKQALGASDDAEDDEDEDEPGVQMTVEEALHNPLFIISIQPDIRGCIVCPRKLLKNDIMASVHTSSQAHRRRISKFKEAAASAKPDDDARNVLSVAFVSTPLQPKLDSDDPAPLSNRAAKRIAKLEKVKTKRRKHKEIKARARAVKNPESGTNDVAQTAEHPKKKQKLDRSPSPGELAERHLLFTGKQSDDRPDRNRRHRSSKVSHAADARTNLKPEPAGKGKKRKERC